MINFKELSKVAKVIILLGAIAGAVSAITVTTVWALDTRYITIGGFQADQLKRDVRDLKRDIRKLEYLKNAGEATDRQLWELDDLTQELEELTQ